MQNERGLDQIQLRDAEIMRLRDKNNDLELYLANVNSSISKWRDGYQPEPEPSSDDDATGN